MIDVKPTMNDSEVEFVFSGLVIVEGVVPDELNLKCEALPGAVSTTSFRLQSSAGESF